LHDCARVETGAYEPPKACNSCVSPGAIEIQIQAENFPYLETVHLLEMPNAIDIHVLPHPLLRVDLYFDGTRVTRSFAAFGGSYAPGRNNDMVSETSGGDVQTMSSLETKENRKEWERSFSRHYIQPVLSTLDQSLGKAIDRVAKDEKQGTMPSSCLSSGADCDCVGVIK
jgi:hypothetical protein